MTFLDILNWDTYYTIFSLIGNYLLIADIIALTRTCRAFSRLYQDLLPLQWDVDSRLRRFVLQPARFRFEMGKVDALISGSFALQFFERVTWPSSDLDLYVKQGEGFQAICAYLEDREGYTLVESKPDDDYFWLWELVEVHIYRRPIPGTPQSITEIQVIATEGLPIQHIVRNVYTTVVVNVISWNKAYALFPLITFIHYRGYLFKALNNYISALAAKYTKRGWKIKNMMWPEEQQTNQPIQSHRRVGDKYTWTIPLDISTVQRSQTPDYVLEHACFRISNAEKTWQDAVAESLGIVYYVMTAGQYTSHALQYTYTHDYSAWVDFLGERTDLLTGLELRKMDPMDRPLHYDEIIDRPNYSDPIYKPPEWTYWDSEIQNWYKAWVAESAAQRKIREERKSRRIRGH